MRLRRLQKSRENVAGLTMADIRKLGRFDAIGLMRASAILYACGRDMAGRWGLRHWDHSRLITFAITLRASLQHEVYLAEEGGRALATFQTRREGEWLNLSKLATRPGNDGRGLGSLCMAYAEQKALREGLKGVTLEVYDKSSHAIAFYTHRGYETAGTQMTRKYTVLKMKKALPCQP